MSPIILDRLRSFPDWVVRYGFTNYCVHCKSRQSDNEKIRIYRRAVLLYGTRTRGYARIPESAKRQPCQLFQRSSGSSSECISEIITLHIFTSNFRVKRQRSILTANLSLEIFLPGQLGNLYVTGLVVIDLSS